MDRAHASEQTSDPGDRTRRAARATRAGRAFEAVLVACVLLFLAVTSAATLFVTAYLPNYDYGIAFGYGGAPTIIAAIGAIIVALAIADRCGLLERIDDRLLSRALVGYALITGTIWIFAAHVWPDWDPLSLINAARELTRHGSELYQHGGYIYRFPYQMGYVLFIRLLTAVSFGHAYLMLEGVNIVCTAWIFFLVSAIARQVFCSRRIVNLSCLLCLFFFPLIFYVTFAYAIAIGLALALLAMLLQMRALESGSRGLAALSALAAAGACVLKSNMLVALAALAAVWLCHLIAHRRASSAWGLALLLAAHVAGGTAVAGATRLITRMDPTQGIPPSAMIRMGLSPTGGENYGWYNGYPWKYGPADYSAKRYDAEARAAIALQIDRFISDPAYAWTFFSRKYCSEWCEPTFESLLASNWAGSSGPHVPVMKGRAYTPLARIIYYGPVHDALLMILDVLQTLILLGATVVVIFGLIARRGRSRLCAAHMAPLLLAAGSALFYLFWEAQAQYVMPAYVALLPFAAGGIATVLDAMAKRFPATAKGATS